MTTLLEPTTAPAVELAALYHERWDAEATFDELKTHLRRAPAVLRSRTTERVHQEVYVLLLAHYVVRGLLHEAALTTPAGPRDPDTVSFVHAVRVVRRAVPRLAAVPPSGPCDAVAALAHRHPHRVARGGRQLQPRAPRTT